MTITLMLPFPPALNQLTACVRGRKITSKRGREYRAEVVNLIRIQDPCKQVEDRLKVKVYLYPPCRRKRDIDNYCKALFDAITVAGVWLDDEQIDEMSVYRRNIIKGGKCIVEIEAISES